MIKNTFGFGYIIQEDEALATDTCLSYYSSNELIGGSTTEYSIMWTCEEDGSVWYNIFFGNTNCNGIPISYDVSNDSST